ncbi:hypothetical protein SRRS_53530 [Sporomusa rhizae]|uniref:hypothetical protein n=1 Tax=Sporomusa rhizae TaxID=357999 RepID=UPI00352A6C83
MKKLISGMFSSVSDAELFLATLAYDDDDDAPESVTEDKFADYDQDDLTRAETDSPDVSQATANQGLEDSFK